MIELLLALRLLIFPVAAPAADYELPDLGIRGFTGYTVVEETPVIEEEAPVYVEDDFIEQRESAAPSRSTEREIAPPPPAPEPIVEAAPVAPVVTGGVIDVAAAYVGSPYVLPGNPPYTFDCSSYTWYVYQQAGISIPRTVNGQKAAVTPVTDPQPGDLVFYGSWHHVGIYAGNGMTYEALNPGEGVRYGPILTTDVWYGRP